MVDYAPIADLAIFGLLLIIGPAFLFGLLLNLAFWFERPLPYGEDYERRQREDRKLETRRARQALKA